MCNPSDLPHRIESSSSSVIESSDCASHIAPDAFLRVKVEDQEGPISVPTGTVPQVKKPCRKPVGLTTTLRFSNRGASDSQRHFIV